MAAFASAREAATRISAAVGALGEQCRRMALGADNRSAALRVVQTHADATAVPRDAAALVSSLRVGAPISGAAAEALVLLDVFGAQVAAEAAASGSASAAESLADVRRLMAGACPVVAASFHAALGRLGRVYESIAVLHQAALLPASPLYAVLRRWDASSADAFYSAYVSAAGEHYARLQRKSLGQPVVLARCAHTALLGGGVAYGAADVRGPSPLALHVLGEQVRAERAFAAAFLQLAEHAAEAHVRAVFGRAAASLAQAYESSLSFAWDVSALMALRLELSAAAGDVAVLSDAVSQAVDARMAAVVAAHASSLSKCREEEPRPTSVSASTERLALLLSGLLSPGDGAARLVAAGVPPLQRLLDAHSAFVAAQAGRLPTPVSAASYALANVAHLAGAPALGPLAPGMAAALDQAVAAAAAALAAEALPALAHVAALGASGGAVSRAALEAAAAECTRPSLGAAVRRTSDALAGDALVADGGVARQVARAVAATLRRDYAAFARAYDAEMGKESVCGSAAGVESATATGSASAFEDVGLDDDGGREAAVRDGLPVGPEDLDACLRALSL